MNSRIIRPLAVAGLVLTAAAVSAPPANPQNPAPLPGSVVVLAPINKGPQEVSLLQFKNS